MDFFLFLLLNATLFIRPGEIVPDLKDTQIYLYLILVCLGVSLVPVFKQLSIGALRERPITACVFGLLVAVVLSHASHFNTFDARTSGFEFAKILLYYLLLVGVVNTPGRLRWFLYWLVGFMIILAALALLQYYGAISIPALEVLKMKEMDAQTGEEIEFVRLRSTGIFNDPNDLCLILLIGMGISLYGLGGKGFGPARLFWLAPLVLFCYCLMLTKSRGGFMALIAGILVLFRNRFGWGKAILLSLLALPLMILLFGGRQTSFDLSSKENTGQTRIQFWSEAFLVIRQAPLFGVGAGQFDEEYRQCVHNSYLHSFTELGLLGGTLFFGAFFFALRVFQQLGRHQAEIQGGELRRLRPYLMALLAAYMTGILALSRCYNHITYLVLGLATVYFHFPEVSRVSPVPCFNLKLFQRMTLASGVILTGFYIIVRVFARYG
jgi:hypothetical protein